MGRAAEVGSLAPLPARNSSWAIPNAQSLVLGFTLAVDSSVLQCPKHNGCFDFKTGLAKRHPARLRLATFPVKASVRCQHT